MIIHFSLGSNFIALCVRVCVCACLCTYALSFCVHRKKYVYIVHINSLEINNKMILCLLAFYLNLYPKPLAKMPLSKFKDSSNSWFGHIIIVKSITSNAWSFLKQSDTIWKVYHYHFHFRHIIFFKYLFLGWLGTILQGKYLWNNDLIKHTIFKKF